MAIEAVPQQYSENMKKWKEASDKEIPGCHIEKKGERVLVTIPKNRGKDDDKVLVFPANEIKKLLQDIYMS